MSDAQPKGRRQRIPSRKCQGGCCAEGGFELELEACGRLGQVQKGHRWRREKDCLVREVDGVGEKALADRVHQGALGSRNPF